MDPGRNQRIRVLTGDEMPGPTDFSPIGSRADRSGPGRAVYFIPDLRLVRARPGPLQNFCLGTKIQVKIFII